MINDARDADCRARAVEAPFHGNRPAAAWPTAAPPASGSGKVRRAAGDKDRRSAVRAKASWFGVGIGSGFVELCALCVTVAHCDD